MAAHSAAIISMPILLAAARVDHLLDQDRPDFTGHRNNAIQYLFTQLRMITGAEHGTDHDCRLAASVDRARSRWRHSCGHRKRCHRRRNSFADHRVLSEVNRLPERFYIAAATMSFLLIAATALLG